MFYFSFQPHLTALPPKMELTQVKWLFTHVENEMVLYMWADGNPVSVENQETNEMDPLVLILHTAP